jgi:hypothetical protein
MAKNTHQTIRALLILVTAGAILFAATISFTNDKVALKTNFFSDSGGLLVRSPSLQLVKDIARNTVLSVQYSLDRVSIPPYRGISAKPLPLDGISGASKPVNSANPNAAFAKSRQEIVTSLRSTNWTATAYYSHEDDYVGRLVSFAINHDINQKNTNLSLSLGYGWDTITPTGKKEILTKRNILVDAAITQTLSPMMIMRLGIDVSQLDGFQSNPYRTVFVAGQYLLEQHPDERLRLAGYAKLNTFLRPANASLWTEYRLYHDDWGILSHTLGMKFYQTMSKRLLIRYRYRFYTQSAASFYRKNYSLINRPKYFTDDYKLEPFYSHLYGIMLSYRLEALRRRLPLLENSTLEVKYERFFTSNNFTANIFEIGLSFDY